MSNVAVLDTLPPSSGRSPQQLTTDEICQNRVQHLLQGARPEFRTLQITSHRGTVTLAGQVRSFYLRQLAIRCCQQVVGLSHVDDQLQVV